MHLRLMPAHDVEPWLAAEDVDNPALWREAVYSSTKNCVYLCPAPFALTRKTLPLASIRLMSARGASAGRSGHILSPKSSGDRAGIELASGADPSRSPEDGVSLAGGAT